MIVDNPNSLNQWLISYLEPICDADPQALAKYIMALIKKDKQPEELKKICLEQLEVFLIDETSAFVEKLFITLNNKSYLNTTDHNSTNLNSNHNEQNQQQRSRSPKSHRNVPAPSGSSRRYQQPINTITNTSNKYDTRNSSNQSKNSPLRQQQNSPHKKRRERSRSLDKNFKRNRSRSPQLHHQLQENQQHFINNNKNNRRFRDYDDRNYSMRNNLCTINPNQESPIDNSLVNFTNSNLTNILVQTSTNNQTHQQYTPEPYNPETPKIDEQQYRSSNTINEQQQQNSRNGLNSSNYLKNEFNSGNNQRAFDGDELNNYKQKINYLHQNKHNRQSNNGANIGNNINKSQFRPNNKRNKQFTNQNENSEKTTLLVCKIPPNLNTITNLNEHFSKFGTITNLKIGYDNDLESSLVEFSSNQEALAAYRSTEAVLNNRFIKVFWHSSNTSTGNNSKNQDKLNESEIMSIDKIGNIEKKSSIKDRLGKINEKQASITNNAVSNLLNSGLANAPNQLASLMMIGNNSNILPTVPKLISKPISKPVFDPSKLKKQYQPSVTNNATNLTSNSSTTISTPSNLDATLTNVSKTTPNPTLTTEVKTSDSIDISNADANTATTTNSTTENLTTTTTTAITTTSTNTIPTSNKLTKTINTTKLINTTSINKLPMQINKEKLSKKLELQKKRQGILSTLIQQNRLLIEKLEKSKTDSEKQSIRETLDILTKQIKNLENEIKKENDSIISETNLKKQQLSIS